MEELLTAATTGILRQIAAEEMTKERERKEEERRQAEEDKDGCRNPELLFHSTWSYLGEK